MSFPNRQNSGRAHLSSFGSSVGHSVSWTGRISCGRDWELQMYIAVGFPCKPACFVHLAVGANSYPFIFVTYNHKNHKNLKGAAHRQILRKSLHPLTFTWTQCHHRSLLLLNTKDESILWHCFRHIKVVALTVNCLLIKRKLNCDSSYNRSL